MIWNWTNSSGGCWWTTDTVKNIMKLTIWAEHDLIVSVIGTKLEHFMSGTEFCALNETIIMNKKSNHMNASLNLSGTEKSNHNVMNVWHFLSGIERERSGMERNGTERSWALMVNFKMFLQLRTSWNWESERNVIGSWAWLERFMIETEFCALNETIIMNEKKSNHMNASLNLSNRKKQSQCYDWVNALWAELNVSGAERHETERSVNGKFVNFKMFLTVYT